MSIRTNASSSAARARIRATLARQTVVAEPEAHLAELQADVPIEAARRERVEDGEVLVGGGAGAASAEVTASPRTSTVVAEAGGTEPLERAEGLVERLAGDEPGDHRAGDGQAGREPAEGAPARQPQEGGPHRPLGRGAKGGGGRHGAMVAARPVG